MNGLDMLCIEVELKDLLKICEHQALFGAMFEVKFGAGSFEVWVTQYFNSSVLFVFPSFFHLIDEDLIKLLLIHHQILSADNRKPLFIL